MDCNNYLHANRRPRHILMLMGMGLLILAVRMSLIQEYGTYMPYWDDWGIGSFLHKYLTVGITLVDIVDPANQHRIVFSRLANIVLLELNQRQWDVLLVMIFNSFIWTTIGLFLIVIGFKMGEHINPWVWCITVLIFWVYPMSPSSVLWAMQTHTYFMILFTVCGFWFVLAPVLSIKWWFGIGSLFFASLTLAGGSLASLSALVVFMTIAIATKRASIISKTSLIALAIVTCVAVCLVFIQGQIGQSQASAKIQADFFITFLRTLSWPLHKYIWASAGAVSFSAAQAY